MGLQKYSEKIPIIDMTTASSTKANPSVLEAYVSNEMNWDIYKLLIILALLDESLAN